jgi:putative ABC transport system permease protein
MLLTRVASGNVLRKPFRSITATLAASLACGLVFAATAMLQSVDRTLDEAARRLGADIMVVPEGHRAEASKLLIAGQPSNFYMNESVMPLIRGVDGVQIASPQLFLTSAELVCCSTPRVLLVGYDPETDFTITPWVSYSHASAVENAASVIVGTTTLYSVEGTYMTFFGKLFHMVSSIPPTGMGFLDDSIFMALEDARDMVRISQERSSSPLSVAPDQISSVLVKVRKRADVTAVADAIASVVPGVQVIQVPDLTVAVRQDIGASVWGIVAAGVASWLMTLLVVGLTFSLAVNERRREIGLLRAMGATKGHVIRLFILEAMIVTLPGALLGVLGGWLILGGYRQVASADLGVLTFLPPSPYVLASFALACVTAIVASGTLAALAPAVRSARMDPYEAIREGH